MGRSQSEFPLLPGLGLYAAEIEGNGNCLFNALSDQIMGDQSHHHEIRARVIEYMREHGDFYKAFINVNDGGGARRNPKRKNAGAFSTPVNDTAPTPEEIDRVFEAHLAQMAKGGTYGDNMEITAFSAAYEVDVKIYQQDHAYFVSGGNCDEKEGTSRPVAHIAYHTWEHYSSIRNVNGPHTGPPNVRETITPQEVEKRGHKPPVTKSEIALWKVDVVKKSLPFATDNNTVLKALNEAKGDVDTAVSDLLDNEDRASISSTQGSSSVERDQDDDAEFDGRDKKKQDRRMSRATKALKQKEEQRGQELTHRPKTSEAKISNDISATTTTPTAYDKEVQDTDLEEVANLVKTTSVSNGNDVVVSNTTGRSTGPRLKLTAPKPQLQTPKHSAATREQADAPRAKSVSTAHALQTKGKPAISARDRRDLKKAAQKAAAKERKQGLATVKEVNKSGGAVVAIKVSGHLESMSGMKTLYI